MKSVMAEMEQPCRVVIGNRGRLPIFTEDDIIIRWGNSIRIRTNGAKIINMSNAIQRASNKSEARRIMSQNEVSIPTTRFYGEAIQTPCIARPSRHHKGQNFNIIHSQSDLVRLERRNNLDGWYFSEVIDKTNEYRVHVGHGKVLVINEKPLVEGELRANQAVTEQSWGQAMQWHEFKKKMCKLACDAVHILGLDMGAVDIMRDRENNYYVCEVNTAPTISDSPYSCARYARYFDWIFRHNGGEWWNYEEWTSGKSFAWKNSQLGE